MSGVVRVTVINSGGILKIRLICIKSRLLQHISQASMSIPGIIGSVNHMHEIIHRYQIKTHIQITSDLDFPLVG